MKGIWLKRAKALVFVALLLPLVRLVAMGVADALGANPVEFVIRSTGTWALSLLLASLSVTPLRLWTGAGWLVAFRRMLGLYAFFYACLHMLAFVWIDQWFDWVAIGREILKRPFITIGMLTFVGLVPLAVTSTDRMQRKLGPRWKSLHRISYGLAATGVVHYYWLVKKDVSQPLLYAAILILLLGIRLHHRIYRPPR